MKALNNTVLPKAQNMDKPTHTMITPAPLSFNSPQVQAAIERFQRDIQIGILFGDMRKDVDLLVEALTHEHEARVQAEAALRNCGFEEVPGPAKWKAPVNKYATRYYQVESERDMWKEEAHTMREAFERSGEHKKELAEALTNERTARMKAETDLKTLIDASDKVFRHFR